MEAAHHQTTSNNTHHQYPPPHASNNDIEFYLMHIPLPILLIFAFVLFIAGIIAYPTAFGVYFSRCFKIKFTYGMIIALAPLLGLLLVWIFPPLQILYLPMCLALGIIIIAAVFRQMQGKCTLSTLKNT